MDANFWQVSSSFGVLDENRTSLIFPRSILLNIFTKWPPQLGLAVVTVGMKFSKQELLKFSELVTKKLDAKTGSCEHQQIPSPTQKFSMLIGSKLDRVN